MPKASSLDEEEAMGDDGGGCWRAAALESTASRTLTTHSSPCDVSDDEEAPRLHPDARSNAMFNGSKVVDDSTMRDDYYRSIESPRIPIERASIRSIQIQIESIQGSRRLSGEYAAPRGSKRRSLCGWSDAGPNKKPSLLTDGCCGLLVPFLVMVGPPVTVLVLLQLSVSYTMLFILNIAVALAGWEWSWWSFRIRQRLLTPCVFAESRAVDHNANTTNANNINAHSTNAHSTNANNINAHSTNAHSTNAHNANAESSVEERQYEMLNQQVLAIDKITTKHRANKYLVAAGISLLVTVAVVAVVASCADWIIPQKATEIRRNVLIGSATSAVFSGVFCACLSPSVPDSLIGVVYAACFLVSSLNSFLAHHEKIVHDPELLDSMYVLLVGACAIVVCRIVSSKEVMESTMMTMLDILGLAYLVAPMMAMADFLAHPTIGDYGDVVGTFFVVVSAAEAAYRLNQMVKERYPHFLQRCQRPIAKSMSKSLGYESLLLSIVFGIVGSIISVLCFHGYIIGWQDALVYLGAILMSQFCRLALESMKSMAKLDAIRYQPWVGGFMDLLNPYLLAMIVFHPYIKALVKG